MFIEDILIQFSRQHVGYLNPFDSKILISFGNQAMIGNSFTEKQGKLAIALITKYKTKISSSLSVDVTPFLTNPQFKNPLRVLDSSRNIQIIDHPTYKKAVRVTFPYDDQLLTKFRQEKPKLNFANWNYDEKCWIFSLDERSILFLSSLINEHGFVCDEEFKKYDQQVRFIQLNVEKFVPMVTKVNNEYISTNVPEKISGSLGENLIISLLKARNLGIFIWDETIENELNSDSVDKAVRTFLKTPPTEKFQLDLEQHSLFSTKDIIINLLPCLVVIPGGSELEKIQKSFEFLSSIGISNAEMSVLFRLSNDSDKEFNDFIRDNKLNNALTEKTSVVFLSNNVPKTVLESKIYFNSVLNFNYYSPHYKLKDFINYHQNVIDVVEKIPQRRLNFGVLQNNN